MTGPQEQVSGSRRQLAGEGWYVDAVLLDVDGTLVDSTAHVEQMWRWWAPQFGVDPAHVLSVSHGRRSEDTVADLVAPDAIAQALLRLDEYEDRETATVPALPGAVSFVQALPQGRWAAVTSGGRAIMTARLVSAGIPAPPIMIAAEDVERGKPDPQGYRLAAQHIGVDPRDCLVVEDAPAGIAAGKAAGCVVIALATTYPASELEAADAVVANLTEVSLDVVGERLHVKFGDPS